MTSVQQQPAPLPQRFRPTPRYLTVLTGVFVLAVLAFVVGLLLPYYVNGLDRVPSGELGGYEPEALWPAGTAWASLVGFAAFLGLSATIPGLVGIAALAVVGAVRAAQARSPLALGFAVLALACGAVLVWVMGPTGIAAVTWLLDS